MLTIVCLYCRAGSELTHITSSGWSSTVSEHPNENLQALPESASVVISNADTLDNSIKIDLEAGSQDSSGRDFLFVTIYM